ncbi:hypothetical protein TIFTF001_028416 [Ficus carica]|uniref:Uncharacterized protein n=1 Tax=Ficus carica TaxID=3494 RepID=A0AA88DR29_FICCA|nr:hypothetical protein TIFTF001_028416 [Ficus carica]
MKVMMASKLPMSYRPALGRVGLWFELEMDWPPQPLHSCAPGTDTYVMGPIKMYVMVSNLREVSDARWWSVAGRAVKCGKLCRHAS